MPTRTRWTAVLLLSSTLAACDDGSITSMPPAMVPQKNGAMASSMYQASVDARTGKMTITPAASNPWNPGNGITHAIYGQQGVNVRFYSGTTSIDSISNPPNRTYTFTVGFQNLLNHPIGVIQNATSPSDTIGVYAFFPTPATITSPNPCTGCTVSILQTQGALPITSTNSQRYYYWGQRINSVGSTNPRPDTTLTRTTWVFRTTGGAQSFNFSFLLSAPFPPPSETRWKVDYEGDSTPDLRSEPHWRNTSDNGNPTTTANTNDSTALLISGQNLATRWQRNDSVPTLGNAYIQARMQIVSVAGGPVAIGNTRVAGLRLTDGARYCAIGIGQGRAGIMNGTSTNYQGGTTFDLTTTTYHIYQLSKYAQDSVVMFIDGVRRGKAPYVSACSADASRYEMWGSFAVGVVTVTQWDYVIYEIGTPIP